MRPWQIPPKVVTTKELKAQGWTVGMIKLLGRPDTTVTVGIFHGGDRFKARIYSNAWTVKNVEAVKLTPAWLKLEARRAAKSEAVS